MIVAGADIWKGQWVVVTLVDGAFGSAAVASTFETVLAMTADAAAIGVDIPIGLPGPGRRRPADDLARQLVGPRRHSVFPTPSRDMLSAGSLHQANVLARSAGRPGVSAQAYALGRLILQVDPLAAEDHRVHEVHPEASFVQANGGNHLAWPKTSWNGIGLRRRILLAQGIEVPDDLGSAGRAGVADVLDAAAVAWTAGRIVTGTALCLPPGHGRIGAIWA